MSSYFFEYMICILSYLSSLICSFFIDKLVRWRPSGDSSKSSPPPSFGPSSAAFIRGPFTVTGVYRVSRAEEEKQASVYVFHTRC